MFQCDRVYPNGDQVPTQTLTESEKASWLEYNKVFRFGCALFVDKKCVYHGYLSEEKTKEWEDKLKTQS